MHSIPHLPFVITAIGISGAVFAVLAMALRTDRRINARIRSLEEFGTTGTAGELRPNGVIESLMRCLSPRNGVSLGALKSRLVRAGFYGPLAVPLFSTAQVACGLLGALASVGTNRWLPPRSVDWLLLGLMGGCLGFLLPSQLLGKLMRKRRRLIERGLPDFLDLLVACIDAGLSLESAMQRITDELARAHPALGSELQRVQRDVELGAPTDRALQNFADRTDIDVLRTMATACSQARRFGSRLSITLRGIADALRQQREQQAEEAAQISAVKILFPTLLLLFPIIFVVLAGPAAIQIVEQFSKAGMSSAK